MLSSMESGQHHQYKESEIGQVEISELESINSNNNDTSHYRLLKSSVWYYNISNVVIFISLLVGFIVLISLASATFDKVIHLDTSSVTTVYNSLGLPGIEGYSWKDVVQQTDGTNVNFWMWSGDSSINNWVDNWLAPNVLSEYGIQIQRVPQGAYDAVDQMISEKEVGNTKNGQVDIVWINGENFNTARSNDVLYGPFATAIPSAVNFDFSSSAIKYDFGRLTNGYEMPYNSAQVVFIYNMKYFPSGPPKTIDALVSWIKANPGRFTYPKPQCLLPNIDDCVVPYDFTGSVFIRHFLYYYPTSDDYKDMIGEFNQKTYSKHASYAFTKLREIEPFLYRKNDKVYYPDNITISDALFATEDIWFTLNYDPNYAGKMVSKEIWSNETNSYVMDSGTIMNTNFIAIAKNAKNLLSAIVVTNYIASIAVQFSRREPEMWGAVQCYDPSSVNVNEGGWSVAFEYLASKSYSQTPSRTALKAAGMPELVSTYTTTMQADWVKCVALYAGTKDAPCAIQ